MFLLFREGNSYAVMSAWSVELMKWRSRSHSSPDLRLRWLMMFCNPPTAVLSSLRAGSSSNFRHYQLRISRAREGGSSVWCKDAHGLVGLHPVSEFAIRTHWPRGSARVKYTIAARHCGSIEGRVKAGPHT